jgi:site-specific recombinase XerD
MLTNGSCDAMTLDWAKLRYHHTAAVRAVLMEKYSPATTNKMLTALKRVLQEALKLELISEKDYKGATDLRPVPGSKGLKGRALSRDEIAALLKVCQHDATPSGVRDAALIAILRGSGVRRRELVNLDLSDFEESTGAIEVRDGKGGKTDGVLVFSGNSGGVKLASGSGGRSWSTIVSGEQRQASHSKTPHLSGGVIHLAKAGRRGGCCIF